MMGDQRRPDVAAAAAAADGTRQSLQGGPPKAELPRIDDLPGTDNVDQGNAGSDDIGAGDDYYDEDDDDEYSSSGDELGTLGRVEDADWELARGDFTKMFNRSRQLAQVAGGQSSSGAGGGIAGQGGGGSVPLPAMNRPRKANPANKANNRAEEQDAKGMQYGTGSALVGTLRNASRAPADKTEEQLAQLERQFASRMQLDSSYDPSAAAGGSVSGNVPRKGNAGSGQKRVRDKSDRSTVQQVLDPRTMVILFKMLQRGLLKQVNGVVSTGKEANVYHASTYKYPVTSETIADGAADEEEEGIALALKIYKTSILVFKDRDRYITGEFRFRHGYARHNPRKMVKLWAEKEARNLKRLVGAGMRCPRPIELRDHVLVMEFLEDGTGRNSPRLRDAHALIDARREAGEETIWEDLYVELVAAVRTMFHQCRLVHADLSEYNVLYHRDHLFIIDVSQSVEQDHPYAFDFLRADIQHVDDYFSKRGGVQTLGLRRTFEWVVHPPARPVESAAADVEGVAGHATPQQQQRQPAQEATGDDESLPAPHTLSSLATGPFTKFETVHRGPGESDEELAAQVKQMIAERERAADEQQRDDAASGQGMTAASEEARNTAAAEARQDEAVFRQAYIPQTLNEVYDPERDIDVRNEGKGDDLIYANVIGVGNDHYKGRAEDAAPEGEDDADVAGDTEGAPTAGSASSSLSSSSDGEEKDGGGTGDDDEGRQERQEHAPRGHKHEDRDAKKERKKQAKEAARERRKHKMPKAEKKRRMRTAHK